MKLRTFSMTAGVSREAARDTVVDTLAEEGWQGREVDAWSSIAHTTEGVTASGPFVPLAEIRCTVDAGPQGEAVVAVEQTRHTWLGKGDIMDAKRAGRRFEALIEVLAERLPMAAEAAS